MIDPIDRNSVKFYLQFTEGTYEISEPVSMDAAEFTVKADKGRLGVDVTFASGEIELGFFDAIFEKGLTQNFSRLIQELEDFGFESDVKFIIEVDGVQEVIGEVDFYTAQTDYLTYFRAKIIQESQQAIFKRRMDVSVDVTANKDLDDTDIDPLVPEKFLMKAKVESQISEWDVYPEWSTITLQDQGRDYYHTPFVNIQRSEINNTLSPYLPIGTDIEFNAEDHVIINAQDSLFNFQFVISDFSATYNTFGGNQDHILSMYYHVGTSFDFGTATQFYTDSVNAESYTLTDYSYTSPVLTIERGEKLYLVMDLRLESINPPGNHLINFRFSSGNLEVTTQARAFSSVVNGFRLGNLMRHVTQSVSGLNVIAPRFLKEGGTFYNQIVFPGKYLRQLQGGFEISMKQIMEGLTEFFADYQIQDNENVFFGIYEDFHRDKKIGEFVQEPSEAYNSTFNPEYAINQFNFKYKKYEKDNNEDRSLQAVHTEMETLLPNKRVENKKDVTPGFIRDAFLLEKVRRDAIQVKQDVATEQDEDIFIVDVVENDNLSITETVYVNHIIVQDGVILQLNNNGDFNWSLLGFQFNDFITITGNNAGDYLVTDLGETSIELTAAAPASPSYSGLELLEITYIVSQTNLINRTNEGFGTISGTTATEGFANLRFTPKRNMIQWYGSYLLGCMHYAPYDQDIKVTKFIHNGDLTTSFNSDFPFLVVENGGLGRGELRNLKKQYVEPKTESTTVFCNWQQFWELSKRIRTERGYIDIRRADGETVSVYPRELVFSWDKGLLDVKGNLRFISEIPENDDRTPIGEDIKNNMIFEDYVNMVFEDGTNMIFE